MKKENTNLSFTDINENEIEVVRGDRPYKEKEDGFARHSLKYILLDLKDIKHKYFILGFHLNEFAECKHYEDFGYDSMKDFCLANIPLDYSAVSRCMTVHTYTCERLEGKSGKKIIHMQKKYKDYSYSQLVEMLGMNEEEEKLCTPTMTVKEIRELKKKIKEHKKTSPYKFTAERFKPDNCDVATAENENCDIAAAKDKNTGAGTALVKTPLSDTSIFPVVIKAFVEQPSRFLLNMFRNKFGDKLEAEARGKMLEMKLPGYEVTIRISFKETEETEKDVRK